MVFAKPFDKNHSHMPHNIAVVDGRVAMAMYEGRLGVQLEETHPELENKVTVIFPPWSEQKVTLGVWSRFAITSGTKNQTEAKAFLQWLISGDRLQLENTPLSRGVYLFFEDQFSN